MTGAIVPFHSFMQLKSIDVNEIKTRWAEVLREVRLGERFCITQRGVPVAELVPSGSIACLSHENVYAGGNRRAGR
jgi:prevent-host-death family protein